MNEVIHMVHLYHCEKTGALKLGSLCSDSFDGKHLTSQSWKVSCDECITRMRLKHFEVEK